METNQNQLLMKSETPGSLTRTSKQEPTWTENWTLLRNLWKEWTPTPEMVREVWFRSFDKRHGIRGALVVNHVALREAIISVRKTTGWKEPKFLDVSDAYRHEQNRTLAEIALASIRTIGAKERAEVEDDHTRRLAMISEWSSERLIVAREKVERQFPTFRGKSSDLSAWSKTYTGLVFAADQMIEGSVVA